MVRDLLGDNLPVEHVLYRIEVQVPLDYWQVCDVLDKPGTREEGEEPPADKTRYPEAFQSPSGRVDLLAVLPPPDIRKKTIVTHYALYTLLIYCDTKLFRQLHRHLPVAKALPMILLHPCNFLKQDCILYVFPLRLEALVEALRRHAGDAAQPPDVLPARFQGLHDCGKLFFTMLAGSCLMTS